MEVEIVEDTKNDKHKIENGNKYDQDNMEEEIEQVLEGENECNTEVYASTAEEYEDSEKECVICVIDDSFETQQSTHSPLKTKFCIAILKGLGRDSLEDILSLDNIRHKVKHESLPATKEIIS